MTAATNTPEVVELRSLSKWYGEVIGLNDVTGRIQAGITGLVGPNGAGKSTLMGLITGQLRPSRGSIRVFGQNPWNNPGVLARIGYCPEGEPFWFELSGRRFVQLLARLSGLHGAALKGAVDRALERTAMTEHQHRAIRTYSKGMRQRIKIAQALVHEPIFLVLDEPFTGADPVVRHELAALFRSLAAEGVHILVSSHILHEVEALTRRILFIDHGRVRAEGEVLTIRQEMEDRPHAVRVRVDRPRELARELLQEASITSLHLEDSAGLVFETRNPLALSRRLQELVAGGRFHIRELAPADESLEALFGYLAGGGK